MLTQSTTGAAIQLIDPHHNFVVDGRRFDLSAEEVIKICERDSWQQAGDVATRVIEKVRP